MPPFPKPNFPYTYTLGPQIKALNKHKTARQVPDKVQNRLLILTWNIANLGQQERTDDDLSIIAHIMSWFDVIAVQECTAGRQGGRHTWRAELTFRYYRPLPPSTAYSRPFWWGDCLPAQPVRQHQASRQRCQVRRVRPHPLPGLLQAGQVQHRPGQRAPLLRQRGQGGHEPPSAGDLC